MKSADEISAMSDSSDHLQDTSERFVEGEYATREDYLVYLMAVATYDWAAKFTAGCDVLDYGCGSGWGSARLAGAALGVLGVDVDGAAVAYARRRYQADNLAYDVLQGAPGWEAEFDAVVSIQVVEHVPDADEYLAAAARALRPGGQILIATPNRATRLYRYQKPWNPWHVTEWDRDGLRDLIARHFDDIEIFDMTGDLDWEVARTRRIRMVTLPLTLPFTPEVVRHRSLAAISRRRRQRRKWAGDAAVSIKIVPEGSPSVNLLARARAR